MWVQTGSTWRKQVLAKSPVSRNTEVEAAVRVTRGVSARAKGPHQAWHVRPGFAWNPRGCVLLVTPLNNCNRMVPVWPVTPPAPPLAGLRPRPSRCPRLRSGFRGPHECRAGHTARPSSPCRRSLLSSVIIICEAPCNSTFQSRIYLLCAFLIFLSSNPDPFWPQNLWYTGKRLRHSAKG